MRTASTVDGDVPIDLEYPEPPDERFFKCPGGRVPVQVEEITCERHSTDASAVESRTGNGWAVRRVRVALVRE